MRPADITAGLTLVASVAIVVWVGIDAWILTAWSISASVLVVLFLLGRLLAKELDVHVRRGRRFPWYSGAVGAFISCTMAAGLVRSSAPVDMFIALGALMVLAVTCLRLAYHRPRTA